MGVDDGEEKNNRARRSTRIWTSLFRGRLVKCDGKLHNERENVGGKRIEDMCILFEDLHTHQWRGHSGQREEPCHNHTFFMDWRATEHSKQRELFEPHAPPNFASCQPPIVDE